MTQEEKQILLADLCARLPYGVIYHRNDGANIELREIDIKSGALNYTDNIVVRECKPYLRPMSSMTEEEEEEYNGFLLDVEYYPGKYFVVPAASVVDWLLSHHFDYRIDPSTGKSMIESNLALEATEDMYKAE